MRLIIGFLFLPLLFFSCKKNNDPGGIKYKVSYSSSTNESLKNIKAEEFYTQFGTYITSLTPYHFSASINMMGMQSSYDTANTTIVLELIMPGESDKGISMIFPKPQADFSNNQEVEFSPLMRSQVFPGQQITFTYFYFMPFYIYQEIILPLEYQNVTINQFNEAYPVGFFGIDHEQYYCDSVKSGNVLKIKDWPFITRLHSYKAGTPHGVVFGNTDSTFIFNKEGNLISNSVNNPFGGGSRACYFRSNQYEASSITIPETGDSLTVKVYINFNTDNLIQVYAGADNIPYTSDDIFVYAPKYWERIKVKLQSY